MDSQTLRKRAREREAQADSTDVRQPKRYHCDQTLADDEEKESASSEELAVKGVMRSLHEKIAVICSLSYPALSSGDKLAANSDISSSHEGQTLNADPWLMDLCYLLEASDDDLGIPPNPLLDSKGEVYPTVKEITSESFSENFDLKSVGENWHYENDFDEYYQQFELFEDAWDASLLQDYTNGDHVNEGLLFDGDFPGDWKLPVE